MKKWLPALGLLCGGLLLGGEALGQTIAADRVTVPLRDPSRPALVKSTLLNGRIQVKGYDGQEIKIEARLRGRISSAKDGTGSSTKRIELGKTGLTVEEENNVVSVSTGSVPRTVDLLIEVPLLTSLKLACQHNGDILVESVAGEIEANALNGSITLTKVSGVIVAHSLNGDLTAQMDKVTPGKPMSFSTLNGHIDVTLPSDLQADLRIATQNGKIYTDFEIALNRTLLGPRVKDAPRNGAKYRISFDKGVSGSVNGGGAAIQFKTVNGSIHVRKKE